jgi:peptide/nickel transport system substrate-binding protein
LQENLKKLRIKVNIKQMEWTAFLERIDQGDADAFRLGWGMASPPHHMDMYQIWHSSQIGDKGSNHVGYANPELDRLLEAARKELDDERRKALEFKIQELLYNDQPYLWMYMPAEFRAYPKWRGVKMSVPRPGHDLTQWYLAE